MFKKIFIVCFVLLSLTVPAAAQQNKDRFFTTFDTESITVAGTAIGFTATKIKPTGAAYRAEYTTFVVECSSTTPCPIRITTVTATPPTSAVGLLLNQGDTISIYGYDDISAFKAIRTGANSAVIQPLYSR